MQTRTQEEIDAMEETLQGYINSGTGRADCNQIQIDVITADDYETEADKYEDDEDSWRHQAAEEARQWMEGEDFLD